MPDRSLAEGAAAQPHHRTAPSTWHRANSLTDSCCCPCHSSVVWGSAGALPLQAFPCCNWQSCCRKGKWGKEMMWAQITCRVVFGKSKGTDCTAAKKRFSLALRLFTMQAGSMCEWLWSTFQVEMSLLLLDNCCIISLTAFKSMRCFTEGFAKHSTDVMQLHVSCDGEVQGWELLGPAAA